MATYIPMDTLEHVTYKGTELNALDVAGCKWRKPYTLTIPSLPTGVKSAYATKNSTETNCQTSPGGYSTSGTVYYGDKLSTGGTASAGYNIPTITFGDCKDIIFPSVGSWVKSTILRPDDETTMYRATASATKSYSIGSYSYCTINGIQLGTDNTIIYNSPIIGAYGTSITYYAKFFNETLTLTTSATVIASSVNSNNQLYVEASSKADTASCITSDTATVVTGDLCIGIVAGSPKTFYVYYNQGSASSATNLPSTQSYVYGNTITLATNSMTKNSITSNGYTVTLNYNGSGTSNTTLTQTNTTTYTANGWTTSLNGTKKYDDGATYGAGMASDAYFYPCFTATVTEGSVTLPTPTRSGYVFLGWATSSTATSGSKGTYKPTSNITLYAIWKEGVAVMFPSVASKSSTTFMGSAISGYELDASETNEYTGYSNYNSCTVDDITVGTSYTAIATDYTINTDSKKSYTTYSAKFVDGTLTLKTIRTAWSFSKPDRLTTGFGASRDAVAQFGNKLKAPTYTSTSKSTSYIYITFSNPNSVATTLHVTYGVNGTEYSRTATISASGTTKQEFSGLSSGTTYTFKYWLTASEYTQSPTSTLSVSTTSPSTST